MTGEELVETGVPSFAEMARKGTVHFMGIGGAGMCALAELVLNGGGRVSGCDLKPGYATARLAELGATVHEGHDPAHLEGAAGLVVTAAVPEDHPELAAARERGIPVLKRARALGQWIERGTVVGVSGTHGKTSTTAMATEVLAAAGMNPTGFVGGRVAGWGGNLRYGSQELFVVEADEYDRSFHEISPDVAIVTNVEADHLDTYGDFEGVVRGFHAYLEGLSSAGRAVVCGDDHGASRLLPRLGARGYSYGLNAGALLRAVDPAVEPGGTRFRVIEEGTDRGELLVSAPGYHNLRNALGAAGAARALGASWDDIRTGLAAYGGVGRRFERLGEAAGAIVIDDYAHHPTEVTATVSTARRAYPDHRIVAVFQPHLYSRTRDFHGEFGFALSGADLVVVTDIFGAREEPIPGVTGELVADAIGSAGRTVEVHYVASLDDASECVLGMAGSGDLILTMGAGSIERLGPSILGMLRERGGDDA